MGFHGLRHGGGGLTGTQNHGTAFWWGGQIGRQAMRRLGSLNRDPVKMCQKIVGRLMWIRCHGERRPA